MTENFIICIKAVIPMFCMLFIGFLVKKSGIVSDSELNKFNKVVFCALFPFLMFANIYESNISEVLYPKLIIFTIVAIGVVYGLGTCVTLAIEKNSRSRGALIQAIYRSNFVIMGLPIATNIYGHSNIGMTAVMVAIVVPIYNVLAVFTLEFYRGSKVNVRVMVHNIIKNPLILGAFFGIVFLLLGIRLPEVLNDTVVDLSSAATPIALIILGASFNFNTVKDNTRNLVVGVLGRLVVVPGICLTAAALLGIRGIAFVTLISIFAAPCAISSFTMAQQMDSDANLAGGTVIFTSAFSCFTMFAWLLLFKTLGMF